jgi:hypothetical protein
MTVENRLPLRGGTIFLRSHHELSFRSASQA